MKFERVTTETKEIIIPKDDFIPFRTWYDALDNTEKRKFRNELLRVSGMQFPTFYSKLRRNSFSPLEMEAMCKIIFSIIVEKIHIPPVVEVKGGKIEICYTANHRPSDL